MMEAGNKTKIQPEGWIGPLSQVAESSQTNRVSIFAKKMTVNAQLIAMKVHELSCLIMQWVKEQWTLFCHTTDLWIAHRLSRLILPAVTRYSKTEMEHLTIQADALRSAIQQNETHISRKTLEVDAKMTLSGIEIKSVDEQSSKAHWIIYFQPNMGLWEVTLSHLQKIHNVTKKNVLCYNYPGVGKSTGIVRSQDDVLRAARTVVQSLLKKNIKPENILLHGFSFGGFCASIMAAEMAEKGEIVALCNERSGLSIPHILHEQSSLTCWISWVVVLYNWTLNANGALARLTARNRVLFISNPKDTLILLAAQAVNAIKHMKAEVTTMTMEPHLLNELNEHARPWTDEEYTVYGWHVAALFNSPV
jgi:hypothetical protein